MKVASIALIKKELRERTADEMLNLCLRMAKYKNENKELLNYLLFEAYDEENFKDEVRIDINEMFSEVNLSSIYFAKKTIRKILRFVNKQIKYSGIKQTEVELLIHFCKEFRDLNLPFSDSKVLSNMYQRQLIRIEKVLSSLNEDLKFDYHSEIQEIMIPLPR